MYGYIGWRMIIPAAFSMPINIVLWAVLLTALIMPFLPYFLRHMGMSGNWISVIAWFGYFSFGFFTLLFAIVLFKDIIFLSGWGIHKLVNIAGFGTGTNPGHLIDPARRQLLTNSINLGILGLTGSMIGYGIYQAKRKPDIVEVDVPIANLPSSLNGFRIIQLTDIHVSHTIRRGFVQTVVDMVNDQKPDLIALTGDLVDGSVNQLREDVAPLADLRAKHGSYFVTGNHDYYSGIQQWLDETRRLGFKVLLNEHELIETSEGKLLIGGVTDPGGGQFDRAHVSDPHKAVNGAPDCHFKILLAHQPRSIYKAAEAGFDYVITGHTHGGQYFPYHFLVAMTQPYLSGLHKYKNTRIYVSKGTGYWGPQIRIGAPSEITVHKLVTA